MNIGNLHSVFMFVWSLLMLINDNSVENLELMFFWFNPSVYICCKEINSYRNNINNKNQFERIIKLMLIEHFLLLLDCYNFLKFWIFFFNILYLLILLELLLKLILSKNYSNLCFIFKINLK